MLPEVCASVTRRFQAEAIGEIRFLCVLHLKITRQNVINQAFATP